MNSKNRPFARVSKPVQSKRWTLGEIVVKFYDLPHAQEMLDTFVACGGECSMEEFIEKFDCPEWAFEFLVRFVDCGSFAQVA